MNAIKKVRQYLETYPSRESSRALARLTAALAEEREYPLAELYEMDMEAFELAMELMQDWRLDRYYASRLRLFDIASNDVLKT